MTDPFQTTDAHWPATEPPPSASLEAVLHFQESLWLAGTRRPVEELLADRPELRESADALLELICNEAVLREGLGEPAPLEEFQRRFPELAERLRLQWRTDGPLASRRSARQARTGPHVPYVGGPVTERIGRYEVQGVLGKGGMGVAYRAWDGLLKRVVALKTLRASDASDAERERFRLEAEAVAKVRHPNVVQIFDVGEHDGQPFFAMEFCAGGSLAERLKGKPLPAAEAARVLEQIARGVAAAHARQIVHRDLKPGNVLLTEPMAEAKEGSTAPSPPSSGSGSSGSGAVEALLKVTDFGLAKKLDADQAQTQSGAVMGTPVYMAPEQAFGMSRAVGPAADVYSLGAMLYECLTGRPPFQGATVADTLDLVRHREPAPVRQLQPRTPRDLETICHKCLRKEPGKRYPTAQEFADDLGRFLDGRPILARPVGAIGRGWRWCRRNPWVASLLAAVIGALTAGVISTSLALRQAWRNEAEAKAALEKEEEALEKAEESRRDEFRAVDTAFRKISEERLYNEPGMMELRRDLLKASAPFYEGFVAKRRGDPRWRLELARALRRLGIVNYHLGSFDDSIRHFQEALALYQQLSEADPNDEDLASGAGACLLEMGHAHAARGQLDQADRCYARSQVYVDRLGRSSVAAEILAQRAQLATLRGDLPGALGLANEAVERGAEQARLDPDNTRIASRLADAHLIRGEVLRRVGKREGALKELDGAVAVFQAAAKKEKREERFFRWHLALAHSMRGRILIELRRHPEAMKDLRTADGALSLLKRQNPTVQGYARDWADNLKFLALACGQSGDLEGTRDALERLYPEHPRYAVDLANSYRALARRDRAGGKLEEATRWNVKAIEVLQKCPRSDPLYPHAARMLAEAAADNAQTLGERGDHKEALKYWDLCLEHGGAPDAALIRLYRAASRAIVGDWKGAFDDLRRATGDRMPRDAQSIFAAACAFAAMAEGAAKDESLAAGLRERTAEAWTKEALALLKKAKEGGHQKGDRNVKQWKTARALDSLRKLPEFEAMLPK
jgi:serine/threonine protein kinase/tetratricopeptide (TPR) repeat protein